MLDKNIKLEALMTKLMSLVVLIFSIQVANAELTNNAFKVRGEYFNVGSSPREANPPKGVPDSLWDAKKSAQMIANKKCNGKAKLVSKWASDWYFDQAELPGCTVDGLPCSASTFCYQAVQAYFVCSN